MTEILVSLIAAFQGVTIAGIGAWATISHRQARKTEEVHAQVVNHHSSNLRDELDSRHREVKRDLSNIRDGLHGVNIRMGLLEKREREYHGAP